MISHLRVALLLSTTFLDLFCLLEMEFLLVFSFTQAMVIVAWNGGTPSDIFDKGVFKQVLSIFITAAVMKMGQGMLAIPFPSYSNIMVCTLVLWLHMILILII